MAGCFLLNFLSILLNLLCYDLFWLLRLFIWLLWLLNLLSFIGRILILILRYNSLWIGSTLLVRFGRILNWLYHVILNFFFRLWIGKNFFVCREFFFGSLNIIWIFIWLFLDFTQILIFTEFNFQFIRHWFRTQIILLVIGFYDLSVYIYPLLLNLLFIFFL